MTDRAAPAARGDAKPTCRPTPRAAARAAMYECATCGARFAAWAPAERHADEHHGATIRWLGVR
jgi:hypothetical protein